MTTVISAKPAEGGVEAVDRALSLLGCFGQAAETLPLAELARRSGYHKSTILRLSVSLIRHGFLVRQTDGRFRLGPELWHLGALYRAGVQPAFIIRPELQRLTSETGETASFYVRDADRRVCLYREEPERSVRHSLSEGAALPMSGGASALVLHAWGDRRDPSLDETRRIGHAVSRGARDPDVAAIAVPVLHTGRLLGALTLSGPIDRFERVDEAGLLTCLKASADRIAADLATSG